MNNIDKQHSWDRIRDLILNSGVFPNDSTAECDSQILEGLIRLLIADTRALNRLQMIGSTPTEPPLFTDDQLATLKILIGTAVWIRSEQLAHPNAVLRVALNGDNPFIVTEVDTHNVVIKRLRNEFEAGQQLYTQLATYCAEHAVPAPEWAK